MNTQEIINFIEAKRKTCLQRIQLRLKSGEISNEIYNELALQNEQITENLKRTFTKGQNLIEKKLLGSELAFWDYRKKPKNEIEAFETMREIILEDSENPCVRKFALEIAERSSQARGIRVPIPPVHELYSEEINAENLQNIKLFIDHCEKVARDIYKYVKSKTVYVSDPPDDYFQRAYHTLEIMDLRGDCDDLAIFLCSTLRSIGYRTYLAFQPNHVFAGVILAKPNASENRLIEYIEVPLDPQLEDFKVTFKANEITFDIFDIISSDFVQKLHNYYKEYSREIKEDYVKEIAEGLENALKKLTQLSKAHVSYIDGEIPSIKIVDVFKRELSHFISLVKAD